MKKYFITGVSDGLGREMAARLLREGNTVYGVSRRKSEMDGAKGTYIWRQCDVGRAEEIAEVVRHQESIRFVPDVVILNAGIHRKEGEGFLIDGFLDTFRINSEGALRWVGAYLPFFINRRSGHFVYVSSLSAIFPFPFRAAYSSSKSYMSTVFSCLRRQYSGSGIYFTTVYPGLLSTGMSAHVNVPGFFKYPVSKAAEEILRSVSRKKARRFFPLQNVLLEVLLFIMPDRLLLRLLKGREKG